MECNELVEKVTDFLDGALAGEDVGRFDHHAGLCPGCQAHLNEVAVMLRLTSHVPAEPLPERLEADLLTVYRDWRQTVDS